MAVWPHCLQLKKHGYQGSVVVLSTVKEAWLPGQCGHIIYSYRSMATRALWPHCLQLKKHGYLGSVVILSTVKEAWLPGQCGHIVYS